MTGWQKFGMVYTIWCAFWLGFDLTYALTDGSTIALACAVVQALGMVIGWHWWHEEPSS